MSIIHGHPVGVKTPSVGQHKMKQVKADAAVEISCHDFAKRVEKASAVIIGALSQEVHTLAALMGGGRCACL